MVAFSPLKLKVTTRSLDGFPENTLEIVTSNLIFIYYRHYLKSVFHELNLLADRETPSGRRSKARVYGRSLAKTAGSNAAEGMDVCLVNVCVVR